MRLFNMTFLALLLSCASTVGPPVATAAAPGTAANSDDTGQAISHYLTSILHQRMGQFQDAIGELRAAADLAPDSMPLQIKLLGAYYVNQDYENARVMAERAVKQQPGNVTWRIWLGRIYYQLERFDDAIETFQEAVAIAPDSTAAYEALVEIEEEVNDLVGAIAIYEKLLDFSPDSAFLHYRFGLSLAKIDDGEGARRELEKALELNPKLTAATYLLAIMQLEAGDAPEAARRLLDILAEYPDRIDARSNLAAAMARQQKYDDAITLLTEIVDSGKGETRHHVQRLFLLLRKGGPVDASLAAAPNGAPYMGTLLKALIHRQAGEPYAEVVKSLDSTEGDLDFECTRFLNDLLAAFGQEDAGSFLEAQLKSLRGSEPNSKVLDTVLSRLLMSTGKDEEARDVLLQIVSRYGGDKWIHYYLGTVYESLDNRVETEKHLRACLQYDPNDPDVMNFLGYMFAEENRNLDEAEELLERALKLDPENGFYLDSLGWIYYRKGDAEKAVDLIKRAIREMSGDDAVLRDHLGDAYLLRGEKARAISEWRRAIRLDPSLEGIQEKIDKYLRQIGE